MLKPCSLGALNPLLLLFVVLDHKIRSLGFSSEAARIGDLSWSEYLKRAEALKLDSGVFFHPTGQQGFRVWVCPKP